MYCTRSPSKLGYEERELLKHKIHHTKEKMNAKMISKKDTKRKNILNYIKHLTEQLKYANHDGRMMIKGELTILNEQLETLDDMIHKKQDKLKHIKSKIDKYHSKYGFEDE